MSNGWVLPFQEVIDYSRAGINWDERLLIELKDRLKNMNDERVMKMRSQAAFLYTQYFRLERALLIILSNLYDYFLQLDRQNHSNVVESNP